MDSTERQIIDDLFGKLREAEAHTGPRDPEAERHIEDLRQGQPAAPYYMAQAILVQEEALKAAQARIQELEAKPAGGGFLGGLFGGGTAPARPAQASPWGARGARPSPFRGYQGRGGFLGGAMQTAMGVAGGVVLGSLIADAFTGDAAQAAEEAPVDDGFDTGDMGDMEF